MRHDRFLSRAPGRRNAGFALIAVLFGLAIIALLLAAAANRNVSTATDSMVEETLARRLALKGGLSEVAIALGASNLLGDGIEITWEAETVRLWAEDVAGRVDLNSGDPALVKVLLDGFGAALEAMDTYAAIRRQRTFSGALDFAMVMEIDPDRWTDLARSVTIYSGRSGISTEWTRGRLLSILDEAGLMTGAPDNLVSSPSNEIYVVLVDTKAGVFEVGTLQLGGSRRNRRILNLDLD